MITVTPLHNLFAPRVEKIPASRPLCQGRRPPGEP
jgi:hypothetical protein